MGRSDFSDTEWELTGPQIPSERGRWARHARTLRQVEFGLRPVPEQGVWDALLQTLVDLGLTDDWQHMIDSNTVRDHV